MSDKREPINPRDFFKYVSTPMNDDHVKMTFKAYNIIPEKVELYHEFVISLFDILFSTYLGPEHIDTDKKVKEHFEWTWEKNRDNFFHEGINIKINKELKDYFLQFTIESYYNEIGKDKKDIETKIRWFWRKCFSFEGTRTRSELDILLEVYQIFEKSLE
tara:strand:+ start:224 stop:703 length:480 start_codon:yes stop_codon:yes gene_type:complete